MNQATRWAGIATTLTLVVLAERPAHACGGCFHPPTQTASDITDERMLVSVSPTQTTLYDQIRYSGSPSSFAWVLPIHGAVEVGLSADVLFDAMDTLTATTIQPPASPCPSPSNCGDNGCSSSDSASFSDSTAGAPAVTVTKQENVGPYATVQLHATDAGALNQWLADNGFEIPADVTPVIDQYVAEKFDFLAMKLLPNQGIQAMRPVRITTQGASLSLPLRMAGIGTGVTVGITLWVVSDGRYEPQNYPMFRIDDSELVWDWTTNLSNYTTLRAQHENALGNRAWEIESSLALNQQTITNAILSGGSLFGGSASPAAEDYLAMPADPDAGSPSGESAEQVRADDLRALFAGITGPNARVTRMRTDILHAAMTADLVLQASADQTELTNVRLVTESVNLTCTVYDGCDPHGTGTLSQAQASVDGGGCITAPRARKSGLAAVLGIGAVGLVLSRILRSRARVAR